MVLRIFKMIATSGFLTALECTKFVFGRGSVPDPAGGANGAPPDPVAGVMGHTSKEEGRGGRGRRGKGEKKAREREREGPPPIRKFLDLSLEVCSELRLTELGYNALYVEVREQLRHMVDDTGKPEQRRSAADVPGPPPRPRRSGQTLHHH